MPPRVLIGEDYRDRSLSDSDYRLFAWSCEAAFGKRSVETSRSGEDTFVRCGRFWPGTHTLAAKTADFDRAFEAYWADPDRPLRIEQGH